ncbi:MAG: hypothetical protein KME05_00425 [Gloeocapsa sp. UFS-A4-WI-NPMV-4B04]|nr:hypothetical protein [Gloeocapsa sp. UFS-A4-WI-NPMV-4B04]
MSLSSTSNQLSYKELQAALRTAKENGLTSIKLNSKMEVLQDEYNCITNKTVDSNSNYPFCENTVKVENKPVNERSVASDHHLFTTKVIPAMNSKYAPTWLCRPYVVYVIDGVDYLQGELEAQLQGQVCELPAAVNERKLQANQPPRLKTAARKDRVSKARPVTAPIVNVSQELPKAKLTFKSQEEYNPYFIDVHHSKFTKTLGDVEKQAARNLEDAVRATKQGLRNVVSFAKGFHARQVERASQAA